MVELMVAITLALLLTGAVLAVFIGSRAAYESTAGVGALSDSGRFALGLIGESARGAGNLACNSAMSATSETLLGANTFANNFGLGVEGFEANGTGNPLPAAIVLPAVPAAGAAGNWTPNLDPAITGAIVAPPLGLPVTGSDVLVLRSAVPRVAPVYTTADVAPGATNLTVTALPVGMNGNGYAAVSDCTKSTIFQVPGGGVAAGATAVTVTPAGLGVGFSAGALVAPLTTTVYYIGIGSDGDASLWRLEQVNGGPGFAPEELVPDVENMQVLYGIDSTGTQTASAYVTADQVGTTNVVSIQVALLVASPPGAKPQVGVPAFNLLGTTVTAPVDMRMRKVFYATINLRNAVN
jgi:type IV pilus assembly protein PilW